MTDRVAELFGDNWPRRRRFLMIIVVWMCINVEYILVFGSDNALNQQAFIAFIGAIVAVVGSYVFGAVWDDKDKRKHLPKVSSVDREEG